MMKSQVEARFKTQGKSFLNITAQAQKFVEETGCESGLLHVFVKHTSCGLLIQENADPDVRKDFLNWFEKTCPESENYEHRDEGPDDMPAHLKTALCRTSEMIPVLNGKLQLGAWQALYLVEHRERSHERTVFFTALGVNSSET